LPATLFVSCMRAVDPKTLEIEGGTREAREARREARGRHEDPGGTSEVHGVLEFFFSDLFCGGHGVLFFSDPRGQKILIFCFRCLNYTFARFYFAVATGSAFQSLYDNVSNIRNYLGDFWEFVAKRFSKNQNVVGL
jgi:hypothetical protein